MRVFLILGGAIFGLALAFQGKGWLGAMLGAFVGYAVAEFASWRTRIARLENELAELRRRTTARDSAATESANTAHTSRPPHPAAVQAAPDAAPPLAQGPTRPAPTLPPATPAPAARSEAGVASSSSYGASGYSAPRPSASSGASPESGSQAPPRTPPRAPQDPAIIRAIREYFTGGNTLVRVGVVILFIGVAFLLRYVAEHTHVPIQLRLSGVALGGVVLLALGWRLRKKRPGYALALQGGAIAILYLTVFASLRLFHVLPSGPAFLVLVVLSAFTAALAVLQNSMAFALLAIGCGFLAPVLASSGQGNHVVLFSYYGVLNLGILAIAWFKAWRPLNVAGFLFTFVIGTAWGVLRYRQDLFATTEPFLIAFFLLYVAIAVLFSLRQQPVLNGYVDGTIVFGTPAVAFGLQTGMVREWHFALAHSALAVSALYLVLAWWLYRGKRDTQRLLVEAFMAIGVVFLTLAVPLALDGRWSAATWALEGAALVWVGCRQGRLLPRAFGTLLQVASGVIFLFDVDAPYGKLPVLNSACLGGLMIAVASVFACRSLIKAHGTLRDYESVFAPLLFFWGLLWWLIAGFTEINRHVASPYVLPSMFVFLAATAVLCSELYRRLDIAVARLPQYLLLPVMLAYAALMAATSSHPFHEGGWVAWPIAFAAFYFLCHRHKSEMSAGLAATLHAAGALLLVALIAWEFAWAVNEAVKGGGSWSAIAWAIIPATALFVLPRLCARFAWPFGAHREAYVGVVGSVLALYVMFWSLGTNLSMPGDPYPLPYVPLLNPLDIAQVFVLLVLVRHGLHIQKVRYSSLSGVETRELVWALAALVFVWLNAVLLRTIHHYAGVPYQLESLFRSTLVQTALTIFWTVLALGTMLFATRRSTRIVWVAGAVLMAVVIGKLFLIDLSRIGTVERIVSFVGVGLLMLVVGYFSPLPPAQKAAAA